ncbi:MAG: hypothetical protein K6E95_05055, partial [Lachnospiraceae bacterium]|nr:hypothetical protein [Lachnospiraceae bacterium]
EAIAGEDGLPTHILIGVGINISTDEFPGDIKDTAGSILGLTRSAHSLTEISEKTIKRISSEIYRAVTEHLDPAYDPIDDYKKRSVVLGHDITYTENGTPHSARAIDIGSEGELIVKLADTGEIKTLSSGEISLRLI